MVFAAERSVFVFPEQLARENTVPSSMAAAVHMNMVLENFMGGLLLEKISEDSA